MATICFSSLTYCNKYSLRDLISEKLKCYIATIAKDEISYASGSSLCDAFSKFLFAVSYCINQKSESTTKYLCFHKKAIKENQINRHPVFDFHFFLSR